MKINTALILMMLITPLFGDDYTVTTTAGQEIAIDIALEAENDRRMGIEFPDYELAQLEAGQPSVDRDEFISTLFTATTKEEFVAGMFEIVVSRYETKFNQDEEAQLLKQFREASRAAKDAIKATAETE